MIIEPYRLTINDMICFNIKGLNINLCILSFIFSGFELQNWSDAQCEQAYQ